jgi:hypothetical protein
VICRPPYRRAQLSRSSVDDFGNRTERWAEVEHRPFDHDYSTALGCRRLQFGVNPAGLATVFGNQYANAEPADELAILGDRKGTTAHDHRVAGDAQALTSS